MVVEALQSDLFGSSGWQSGTGACKPEQPDTEIYTYYDPYKT